MQATSDFRRTGKDTEYHPPLGCSDLFGTPDDWDDPPHANNANTLGSCPTKYLDFPVPTLPTSEDQALFGHAISETVTRFPQHGPIQASTMKLQPLLQGKIGVDAKGNLPEKTLSTHYHHNHQPQTSFRSLGRKTVASQDAYILSFPDAYSDSNSFDPSQGSFNKNISHLITSTYTPSESAFSEGPYSLQRRGESTRSTTTFEASVPAVGSESPPRRRRKLNNVEPGSSRAIYLEKNRNAARRCRNKQKRQQEELVVTARHAEHKNKDLKAKEQFLKSVIRKLIEMAEQHNQCPDRSLSIYLQQEGDRLVAEASGRFLSANSSSSRNESLEKA